MKWFIAVAVLVTWSGSPAFALRHASGPDRKELIAILQKVTTQVEVVKELRRAKAKLPKGATAAQKEFDAQIAAENVALDLARKEAIYLTIIAYDIVPTNPQGIGLQPAGTSVSRGPTKNGRYTWLLVARDNIPLKQIRSDGSSAPSEPVDGDPSAATTPDGLSRVFPKAFLHPEWLAGALVHERTHFEQYTTPNKADLKTPAELDVAAYEDDLEYAKQLGFPENELQNYLSAVKSLKAEKEVKAVEERAKFDARKARGEPPSELFTVPTPKEELKAIMKEAAALSRQVADASNRRHLQTLGLMAQKICDQKEVTQAEFDDLRYVTDPGFYHDEAQGFIKNNGGRSCWAGVYQQMLQELESGRTLSASAYNRPWHTPAAPSIPVPPAQSPSIEPYRPEPDAAELAALATKACADPNSVNGFDVAIGWFPTGKMLPLNAGSNLSGCAKALFDKLMGYNATWAWGQHLSVKGVQQDAQECKNQSQPNYGSPGRHGWSKDPKGDPKPPVFDH